MDRNSAGGEVMAETGTERAETKRARGEAVLAGRTIVHVVRQFHPGRGGLEDVVMNLARASVAAGAQVKVITLDRIFADPERMLAPRETVSGIEIVRVPFFGSKRYPLAFGVFRHLAGADLIHVHAIDFFFDALALASPFIAAPMLVTTHGGFFHTRKFATLKAVWFKTLTRFSASRYAHVVGCSLSDRDLFASIAPNRVRLVENGTDTAKFANAASRVPRRHAVTIGRFSSNKRLDNLIAALASAKRLNDEWRLDIVGVPSDLTAVDLARLIARHGVEQAVRVHLDLGNAEIAALMGDASLFASASDYEGFGLVAIEAMSAGLLPVLHRNAAYEALAGKHGDIIVTDFHDPETAAHALEAGFAAIATDPERLRERLIDTAETYSWTTVARNYFALYADMLGAGRAA